MQLSLVFIAAGPAVAYGYDCGFGGPDQLGDIDLLNGCYLNTCTSVYGPGISFPQKILGDSEQAICDCNQIKLDCLTDLVFAGEPCENKDAAIQQGYLDGDTQGGNWNCVDKNTWNCVQDEFRNCIEPHQQITSSPSAPPTLSPSAVPTSTPEDSSSVNTAVIAGGAVGGVAAVAGLVGLAMYLQKQRGGHEDQASKSGIDMPVVDSQKENAIVDSQKENATV